MPRPGLVVVVVGAGRVVVGAGRVVVGAGRVVVGAGRVVAVVAVIAAVVGGCVTTVPAPPLADPLEQAARTTADITRAGSSRADSTRPPTARRGAGTNHISATVSPCPPAPRPSSAPALTESRLG
jgi:hypothetical protein